MGRGWFWASSLQSMGETNVFNGRKFNGWSSTGPLNKPQPDGILKADGFGELACTALLDNFFNDGLSWHDTKCNDRRQIVCEDLPVGNINFVRQQNPGGTSPRPSPRTSPRPSPSWSQSSKSRYQAI